MGTERTDDDGEGTKERPRAWRVLPGRDESGRGRTNGVEPPATRRPFSLTVRIGAPLGDEDDDDSEP